MTSAKIRSYSLNRLSHPAAAQININKDNRTLPMVSSDGEASIPVDSNQTLLITKHDKSLILLHPIGVDFYQACRTKLNWSLYSDEFALIEDQ